MPDPLNDMTLDLRQSLRDELYEMNEPEESFHALTDEFANAKHLDGRQDLADAFIGSDWLRERLIEAWADGYHQGIGDGTACTLRVTPNPYRPIEETP